MVPGSGGAGVYAEAAMLEPIRRIAAQAAEAEDILIEQDSDNLTLNTACDENGHSVSNPTTVPVERRFIASKGH